MYKARYVSSGGQEFSFSYDNGVIFDIAPLSGVPGTVNTSQGYEQVGETYTSVTIGGLQRTINGKILRNVGAIKKTLSNVFIPQSTGKLYFNEDYYCDCVVKTTPEYGVGQNYRNFYIELYCPYPYWLSSAEATRSLTRSALKTQQLSSTAKTAALLKPLTGFGFTRMQRLLITV